MHEILREAFTVRLDENGKELPKPEHYDKEKYEADSSAMWGMECYYYHHGKEAIKLPTIERFEEKLYESGCGAIGYMNSQHDYILFVKTQLSKGQFIATDEDGNVLVEPDALFINDHSSEAKQEQFQKAQEAVIFVCANGKFGYIIKDGSIAQVGQNRIKMDQTLNQALNQGVVFYMKIK